MKSTHQLITEAYRVSQLDQMDFNTLTESQQKFLVENRIAHLISKNPTLDTSHDTFAKHQDAPSIITHFAEHGDPTKNKAHTQWLIGQYKKKNIRQEDTGKTHETLSNFEKYKSKLPQKDLNGYKKLSDVDAAVEPHIGTHATKAAEVRAVKHEGADKVYEDDNISIHHVKNHSAACHYGAGTKWCTAAKDDPSMFEHYTSQGPLHVLNDKKNNRKYQFHANSNSFMSEKDEPISHEEFESIKPSFHRAITEHPEIVGAQNL